MADIQVANEGSVVGFSTYTFAAAQWFAQNVASEGWQWMGGTLWVDPRFAADIIEGAQAAGFAVDY